MAQPWPRPTPRGRQPPTSRWARVLTVFSTKGGVGKSLIAANTAVALSDAGSTVCLVDLDVNSGDVAIMLQLTPTRRSTTWPPSTARSTSDAIESILTPHSDRPSVSLPRR